MYGSPVALNYLSEDSEYKSTCGALISLIIGLTTILYAVQQTTVLLDYRATSFTSYTIKNGLDEDLTIGTDEGFFFAVAVLDISSLDFSDPDGLPLSHYLNITAVVENSNAAN